MEYYYWQILVYTNPPNLSPLCRRSPQRPRFEFHRTRSRYWLQIRRRRRLRPQTSSAAAVPVLEAGNEDAAADSSPLPTRSSSPPLSSDSSHPLFPHEAQQQQSDWTYTLFSDYHRYSSVLFLDLSNNNLSGPIPTNGSFQLFIPISFQNNPELEPLPPPPPTVPPAIPISFWSWFTKVDWQMVVLGPS